MSALKVFNGSVNCELDLSKTMSSIDDFPKGTQFRSKEFILQDLSINFQFYPNGSSKAEVGDSSMFCYIKQSVKNASDTRKLYVLFECGVFKRRLIDPIHKFIEGWGWTDFCSKKYISAHPVIGITVKIHFDPTFIHYPESTKTFDDQIEKIYELSKINGGITLIIKNQKRNDNDDEDDDINHFVDDPPRKKRKLNNNNNNNAINYKELGRIKVSSLLLESSSSVFENMLNSNMIEKNDKQIIVYAKHIDDVDNMIYFMATNQLRKDSNALNIIRLAHFYSIDRLYYQCINKLLKDLNVDNFVDTVNTFDRYEIDQRYKDLVEFAKKNVDKLKQEGQFMKLSHAFRCSNFS